MAASVQSEYFALLPQILKVLRPILLGPEGRESTGEGGVLAMAENPGGIANHTQRPQGFNETETLAVQQAEEFIGIHQDVESAP
jgi:hypothetical protein